MSKNKIIYLHEFKEKNTMYLALTNENRLKIMKKLGKEEKQMRDLYKLCGGDKFVSYKSYYMHIKTLEKAGLIKLKKNPRASGQAVTIIPLVPIV